MFTFILFSPRLPLVFMSVLHVGYVFFVLYSVLVCHWSSCVLPSSRWHYRFSFFCPRLFGDTIPDSKCASLSLFLFFLCILSRQVFYLYCILFVLSWDRWVKYKNLLFVLLCSVKHNAYQHSQYTIQYWIELQCSIVLCIVNARVHCANVMLFGCCVYNSSYWQ